MKKLIVPINSALGNPELPFLIDGITENFNNVVGSIMTPGLIIKRTEGGTLATDFLVSGSGPLAVNPGYLNYNDNGTIRVIKFPGISLSVNYPNGTYYVCIIPKGTNYEPSTISLVNGSNIVNCSSKTGFKYLRPLASIIIDNSDSQHQNGGIYKVINVSPGSATLATPFTGTTEENIKWKTGGLFPEKSQPDSKIGRYIYEYDAYDIIIKSSPSGFELAQIRITNNQAVITRDSRGSYLAEFNNNDASADKVRRGSINDITTIEEKATAGRVDFFLKNLYTSGKIYGLTLMAVGIDSLKVISGAALDGRGKVIIVPVDVTFDILSLYNQGSVIVGDNYLHVVYKQPNSYEWLWRTSQSNQAEHYYLGKVNYDPNSGGGNS